MTGSPRETGSRTSPRAMPRRGPMSLHVDRLIIDGPRFSDAQTKDFVRAVEGELTRLWGTQSAGRIDRGGATPTISAPPISAPGSQSPALLGRQVARSLFAALAESDR